MAAYLLCVVLFLIGVYCVAVKKNLIKIIVGLVIMEYSMNLLLVVVGYRGGAVDPLAQAFALAMIAVGLATTITMSSIAMRIYDRLGTFDITKIGKLKG